MQLRKLGATDLRIAPLVLGGGLFGSTVGREKSFAILDAFLEAGFNAIDMSDVKKESETTIGEWMKDRGVRDRIVLITKGGMDMGEGMAGHGQVVLADDGTPRALPAVHLGRKYLLSACEASLKRLQTDYIDVYMPHRADPDVPIEETLETYQTLIDAGKVRYAGCSNYPPEALTAALAASGDGRARYEALEPHYNLVVRNKYEGAVEKICVDQGLGVITYYALASGFLTGKYRSTEDLAGSARAKAVSPYLNPSGLKLLNALDVVAARHSATPAQVALAWVMARPSVTAPITSATSVEQLSELLKSADLKLAPEDFAVLEL